MVEQLVQVIGALLVLIGFALAQWGRLHHHSATYLVVNLVGSGILSVEAVMSRQLGFLLLEGVWALVSAWGLMRPAPIRAIPEGHEQRGPSPRI